MAAPSSIGGVIWLLVLLVPGFVHYKRKHPARRASGIEALARIVTASAFWLAIALLIVTWLQSWIHEGRIPLADLLKSHDSNGSDSIEIDTFVWTAVWIVMASALAIAYGLSKHILRNRSRRSLHRPPRGLVTVWTRFYAWSKHLQVDLDHDRSAWVRAVEACPIGKTTMIKIVLDDDGEIAGQFRGCSPEPDETLDRAIALRQPLFIKPAPTKEYSAYQPQFKRYAFPDVVVVSAHHQKRVEFIYWESNSGDESGS